jgi:hypothetical protein
MDPHACATAVKPVQQVSDNPAAIPLPLCVSHDEVMISDGNIGNTIGNEQ